MITQTQAQIETAVKTPEGYPSTATKYGHIIAVNNESRRAQIKWVACSWGESGSRRTNKTWIRFEALTIWAPGERVRIQERTGEQRTILEDGTEYTTPKEFRIEKK